jgi:hypothetical protein
MALDIFALIVMAVLIVVVIWLVDRARSFAGKDRPRQEPSPG